MMRLLDRRERRMVLAPTSEELLTNIVKANVLSYRDLPVTLYQIQTKFRDEPRPRAGLIRVREFDMKDAYSFDADQDGLDVSYDAMVQAYKNIFSRCGLDPIIVEADSGAIGGRDSQEFILLADGGEDTIILCADCGYAANAEKAAFTKPPMPKEDPLPLEEVHSPGIKTIDELCDFLDIPQATTIKAVFYILNASCCSCHPRRPDVNENQTEQCAGSCPELRLASPEEVAAAGVVAGSASPVGLNFTTVADDSIHLGSNFAVGANKVDYHLLNANVGRDFQPDIVTDIAFAEEGHQCPKCDGTLTARRGIEVGHVFKLGTRYSEKLDAQYLDSNGERHLIIMGCYGIGVGRLLAAAIEQNHDEAGIVFPTPIAPYDVHLVGLNTNVNEVVESADSLYEELSRAGLSVLFDDRNESPGVKFNDANLIGLPVACRVSRRNSWRGDRRDQEARQLRARDCPYG